MQISNISTLKVTVSHMAKVLSAPIVMSCGALPITLESSTATTPPSWALTNTHTHTHTQKALTNPHTK